MEASELQPGDSFRTHKSPGAYFVLRGPAMELGWLDAIRYESNGVEIGLVQLPRRTIVLPTDSCIIHVYGAGPFFNEEEVANIKFIEDTAAMYPQIILYSPRQSDVSKRFGACKDATEREAMSGEILEENIRAIQNSHLIMAVVDNRDPGTIWEHGYSYGKDVPVVTVTFRDYGLNLMVARSSICHCRSRNKVIQVFEALCTFDFTPDRDEIRDILRPLSDPTGDTY